MKRRIVAWLIPFLVIFNLGYVFHEIVVHDFMTERIGSITRSSYIIPLIALSFAIYVAILVYLYPIFLAYYQRRWHPIAIGAWMGGLMGFLWDTLQGGLIEVATFRMPASVFAVDSTRLRNTRYGRAMCQVTCTVPVTPFTASVSGAG